MQALRIRWPRGYRRLVVAVVVTLVGNMLGSVAIPAAAAPPSGGVCIHSGSFRITPGLTSTARPVSFVMVGRATSCRLSDSSIRSGQEQATGVGTFSCAGGYGTGSFTEAWDNGRRTSSRFVFGGAGSVAAGTGHIVAGEFAGGQIVDTLVLTASDPAACTSGIGLTVMTFEAVIDFTG